MMTFVLRFTFNICFLSTLCLWLPLFLFFMSYSANLPFIASGLILAFGFIAISPAIGMTLYILKKLNLELRDISLFFILAAWILSQLVALFCFPPGLKHTLLALILGGGSHFSLWIVFRSSQLNVAQAPPLQSSESHHGALEEEKLYSIPQENTAEPDSSGLLLIN